MPNIPVPIERETDRFTTPVDIQNTRLEGFLYLANKKLFTPTFDPTSCPIYGVVKEVINNPALFQYDQRNMLDSFHQDTVPPTKYKVQIYGSYDQCTNPPPAEGAADDTPSEAGIRTLIEFSLAQTYIGSELTIDSVVQLNVNEKTIIACLDDSINPDKKSNERPEGAKAAAGGPPTGNTVGNNVQDVSSTPPPPPPLPKPNLPLNLPDVSNQTWQPPLIGKFSITSLAGLRSDPLKTRYTGQKVHGAIDIGAPTGTPLYAVTDGIIIDTDDRSKTTGFGNFVSILVKIGNKMHLLTYGHMARRAVALNQMVKKGDIVGYVGSTGNSTGPHLHFQVNLGTTNAAPKLNPYELKNLADILPPEAKGLAEFKLK